MRAIDYLDPEIDRIFGRLSGACRVARQRIDDADLDSLGSFNRRCRQCQNGNERAANDSKAKSSLIHEFHPNGSVELIGIQAPESTAFQVDFFSTCPSGAHWTRNA